MEAARVFAGWLAVVSALAGCGGGGSGGGSAAVSEAPSAASEPSPAAAPAPLTAPAPADAPTPAPAPAPAPAATPAPAAPAVPAGEIPPSNDAPEPGSTTAAGNGVEGVWVGAGEDLLRLAFVGADGRYLSFDPAGRIIDGALTLSGTAWSFSPATVLVDFSSGTPTASGVSGTGTVAPRSAFQGTYAGGSPIAYTYSNANALAVTQADVAWTWVADGTSIAIDAAGTLTGGITTTAMGDCRLAGSATLADPASRKNVYNVNLALSSAPGGKCNADTLNPYTGYATIAFANVGTAQSPVYARAFTFLVRTDNETWLWGTLRRE